MIRLFAGVVVASGLLACCAAPASAGSNFSLFIGGGAPVGGYYAPPVYGPAYYPAPVYAPPVYYPASPSIHFGYGGGWGHHHHHHHHGGWGHGHHHHHHHGGWHGGRHRGHHH